MNGQETLPGMLAPVAGSSGTRRRLVRAAWVVFLLAILAFLVVYPVLMLLLGALIGRLLASLFRWIGLSWFDRMLGTAFGFVRGVLVAIALVTVLLAFAPAPPPAEGSPSGIAGEPP